MVYVTRFSHGADINSNGNVVLHISEKELTRPKTRRGIRVCLFCVMLVSVLLIASLIAVSATPNMETELAVDGMGSNEKELLFIKRAQEMVESMLQRKQPDFLQDQDKHGMVECIAKVESLLTPFGSEENVNQEDPYAHPQVVILRRLRISLQILGSDPREYPFVESKKNSSALSFDKGIPLPLPFEGLAEYASNDVRKREIIDRMRTDLHPFNYLGAANMIDNVDSTAYEGSYPPALDKGKQNLNNEANDSSTVREKNLGASPQELTVKEEAAQPHTTLANEMYSNNLHAQNRVFRSGDVGARSDAAVKSANQDGKYFDEAFQRFPSMNDIHQPNLLMRFIAVNGDLPKDMSASDQGERTTQSQSHDARGRLPDPEPKFPAGLSLWRRPVALCVLSMAALMMLVMLASVRGYGAAPWRRARIARPGRSRQRTRERAPPPPPPAGDEEMLLPGDCAPLWAKYLSRSSSPECPAVHDPRSTLRVFRDAVRSYGRRPRSPECVAVHPTAAPGGLAGGEGGDGPLPTVHV